MKKKKMKRLFKSDAYYNNTLVFTKPSKILNEEREHNKIAKANLILKQISSDLGVLPYIIHQDDIQNNNQHHAYNRDSQKEFSNNLPKDQFSEDSKIQRKNEVLLKLLLQESKSVERVVHSVLPKNIRERHFYKGVHLDTARFHLENLLNILSAYVIPHLEQISKHKNLHP